MLQVMVALVQGQDYLVAKEELAQSQATPLALVCNKHKECMVTVCSDCTENNATFITGCRFLFNNTFKQ